MSVTDVTQLIDEANKYGSTEKDARFIAYNQPAIDGLSNTNGIEMYIQDKVNADYYKCQISTRGRLLMN